MKLLRMLALNSAATFAFMALASLLGFGGGVVLLTGLFISSATWSAMLSDV